ncbi:uncharacterized protein LOC108194750 [Daucus carota subsp. sativus]|uniref:uncharacterized protein LOC108194750 n=1 Tax=Daucus carota subsp. sativus TaxID=79200 RepID=UPI0007F01489|nr:PREDICTED: uncharacterized protein LOC108194750 [Daucus carota subsp. sativus]
MNNIILQEDVSLVSDAKLCLVGRFLTKGVIDFQAMQQTLAALWRPGKGVHIRELDVNLFQFQFYHELDIKRVIEGSPWSFNRKVLIISRMQQGINPKCIPLNSIDLWVQIHDLQPGLMSEKIITEVGNEIGKYVCSCPTNFKGVWREYMRIRVTMDLSKPLKRRMKIRKSGKEWIWITFRYENVPTFCFICGLLGHSEKFCNQLFEKLENEIVKPYGIWMRAPLKRQTKLIGAKWLCNGGEDFQAYADAGESSKQQNPVKLADGVIQGAKISEVNEDINETERILDKMKDTGDNSATSNSNPLGGVDKGGKVV